MIARILKLCAALSVLFTTIGGQAFALPVGVYDLNILSPSSLGSVGTTLGHVNVGAGGSLTLTLENGISFTGTSGQPGFAFNVDKFSSTAITGTSSLQFSVPPPGDSATAVSTFGTFTTVVTCSSCNGFFASLSIFESAAGGFTNANFVANDMGYYFVGQVIGTDSNTAYIGYGIASPVPEPSTWAMLILGFAGVGFMTYRRRWSATLAS